MLGTLAGTAHCVERYALGLFPTNEMRCWGSQGAGRAGLQDTFPPAGRYPAQGVHYFRDREDFFQTAVW
jgi:hypothetical protein